MFKKKERELELTRVKARVLEVQGQTSIVSGQPELYSKILSQNNNKSNFLFHCFSIPIRRLIGNQPTPKAK